MSISRINSILTLVTLLLLFGVMTASAAYRQQCPPDMDNEDTDGDGIASNDYVCMQIGSGDGFTMMADNKPLYMFGFSDYGTLYNAGGVSDGSGSGGLIDSTTADPVPDPSAVGNMWDAAIPGNIIGANYPAPTIHVKEGQKFYLTLHNVGMLIRPDLFDPHTVHYHGFPNVAAIFDGVPDSAISINMGNSLTYFYDLVEPGTFMYHCHVEASEHMQMGMLGNLYVAPKQDGTSVGGYTSFAYNDTDGATGYDKEYPVQISSFDPVFHDASESVQPLPFADMHDTYPMLNGRGYPDTKNSGDILNAEGFAAQNLPTNITATVGQRIMLRVSSLATTEFYTLSSPSLPMKVVGNGSRILRGKGEVGGADLSYMTNSVTLGGGEAMEIILETAGMTAGTYFLYSTNLNQLSNNTEDFGGLMTEIVLN